MILTRTHKGRAALGAAFLLVMLRGCTGQITGVPVDAGDQGGPGPDGVVKKDIGGSGAKVRWKKTSGMASLGVIHALAASGSTLYVSADSGLYLFVLGATANTKCSANSGGASTPIKAPATIDSSGNVYFTRASQQCLTSVDSGCKARWNLSGLSYYNCGAASNTQARLLSGNQVVAATVGDATNTAHVCSVYQSSGKKVWCRTLTNTSVYNSMVIDKSGTIYVGTTTSTGTGKLYSLPAPGYTPKEIHSAMPFKAPALLASDGSLIIGDWNRNLFAFSAAGAVKWKEVAAGRFLSAPVESMGTILMASSLSGVYTRALNNSSKWTLKYPVSSVKSSGVAVDNAGVAYVGTAGACKSGNGGCLYAFKNGQTLWTYETNAAIDATPLVHNKMVIVGDTSGNLYALAAN